MSLIPESIPVAARRKALVVENHVRDAEADLRQANLKLEKAIPVADKAAIMEAHEQTQSAEKAVIEASEELQVLGELLEGDPPPKGSQSGEGIESLLKSMRRTPRRAAK